MVDTSDKKPVKAKKMLETKFVTDEICLLRHSQVEMMLENLTQKVDAIYLSVVGNGTEGLKTRVTRIEDTHKRHSIYMMIAFTAIGGLISDAVSQYFTR